MIRLVIKDEQGNIVPNAQIHVIEEVYRHLPQGLVDLVTDYLYKDIFFWFDLAVPAPNPLLCNSMGITPPLTNARKQK